MKKNLFIIRLALLILVLLVVGGCKQKQERGATSDSSKPAFLEKTKNDKTEGKSFVAIGSSLSRASNLSSAKQGENEEFSFSLGTKIDSVYLFLKKRGEKLTPLNLASPGAETGDMLGEQLAKALSYNPRYISIDPGADLVKGVSVSYFKKNLVEIFSTIQDEGGITVLIFTYPDFPKMRQAAYSSCKENKVGVELENLTESNILAFNQAMKEASKGKNVLLVDTYGLLGPDDISDYDCLHLNISGQEKIAREFIKALDLE